MRSIFSSMVLKAAITFSLFLCTISTHAQSPDHSDPHTPVESVPGAYLVVHGQSSVIQKAAELKGKIMARSEKSRILTSQKRAIVQEQTQFRYLVATSASSQMRVTKSFSTAVNISVIEQASEADVAALRVQGLTVFPVEYFQLNLVDSVPLIEAPQVWQLTDGFGTNITGEGISIGIIDTGIDYTHPDFGNCSESQFLAGSCAKVRGGYDFYSNDPDPKDTHYHGTHVAGIIAANGAVKGVAPDATLYAYRVCAGGGCRTDAIIAAIDHATDPNQDGDSSDHLDVINMSLGGPGEPNHPLNIATQAAIDAGVVVVVSAGNSGPRSSTIGAPAMVPDTIAVGASYPRDFTEDYRQDALPVTDQLAYFSSRGPVRDLTGALIQKPDVIAPGVMICAAKGPQVPANLATCYDSAHVPLSGTSMAAPHVAGVAALMLQRHPTWTPIQIKRALQHTATPSKNPTTGETYLSTDQGFGRINALRAVLLDSPVTSPSSAVITSFGVPTSSVVPILGTAAGNGFVSFTVETKLRADTTWTMLRTSSSSVSEGVLAELSRSQYEQGGQRMVRLTVDFGDFSKEYVKLFRIAGAEISEPSHWDEADESSYLPHSTDTHLTIRGSAAALDFGYYTIELCNAAATTCSSSGVELNQGGTLPLIFDELGQIDVPSLNLTTGFYVVRLRVFNAAHQVLSEDLVSLYFDTQLIGALTKPARSGYINRSALSVDLENDGTTEYIFVDDNQIYVVNERGEGREGWPVYQPSAYGAGKLVAKDMNGDGVKEIAYLSVSFPSGVYIYRIDGEPFVAPLSGFGIFDAIQLEDVNNDGVGELVVLNASSGTVSLRVVSTAGTVQPGWPKAITGQNLILGELLTVVDTNNDGLKEMFFLTSTGVSGENNQQLYIHGYDHLGNSISGFPKSYTGSYYASTITVADLDRNGRKDLIFPVYDSGSGRTFLHAITDRGVALAGWPVMFTERSSRQFFLPSVGDLDNDGSPEIAIGIGQKFYLLSATGSVLPGWPIISPVGNSSQTPVLANIDQTAESEVLLLQYRQRFFEAPSSRSRIFAYSIRGAPVAGFPRTLPGDVLRINVSKLVEDDQNAIIAMASSYLSAVRLNACGNQDEPWPTHMGDENRSNTYNPISTVRCYQPASSPPVITRQPEQINSRTGDGSSFVLMVYAEFQGAGRVTFQWQRIVNGVWSDLPQGTGYRYVIDPLAGLLSHGTPYRVIISNEAGSVVSESRLYQSGGSPPTVIPTATSTPGSSATAVPSPTPTQSPTAVVPRPTASPSPPASPAQCSLSLLRCEVANGRRVCRFQLGNISTSRGRGRATISGRSSRTRQFTFNSGRFALDVPSQHSVRVAIPSLNCTTNRVQTGRRTESPSGNIDGTPTPAPQQSCAISLRSCRQEDGRRLCKFALSDTAPMRGTGIATLFESRLRTRAFTFRNRRFEIPVKRGETVQISIPRINCTSNRSTP